MQQVSAVQHGTSKTSLATYSEATTKEGGKKREGESAFYEHAPLQLLCRLAQHP